MSVLILTHQNVDAVKRVTRDCMPTAKSGHLTEALASAFGFRTHAALLKKMETEKELLPDLVDCDPAQFMLRLRELGYSDLPVVNLDEIVRGQSMPDQIYAQFRTGDTAANDAHFNLCERHNRPMLTITIARRYARLEWDCITVDRGNEDFLFSDDNGSAFAKLMLAQFQARTRGESGKPHFTGSSFVGWVERLMPNTASKLAEDYFRMLYLPLREPVESKRRRVA